MAFFSKFKIGSTSYDVKDAAAGKTLSVSGSNLNLKNAAGGIVSTVTLPGGGSQVYHVDPITYEDSTYKFYAPTPNTPKVNDILIFESAVVNSNGIIISIPSGSSVYYLPVIDKYTNKEYRLYKWSQWEHTVYPQSNALLNFSTNNVIVTVVTDVQSNYINLDVVDIIPVVRKTDMIYAPLSNTVPDLDLNGSNTWYMSYIYSYSQVTSGITILDSSGTDITADCTIYAMYGKLINGNNATYLRIHTTTRLRIKTITLNYLTYGIPTVYYTHYSSTTFGAQGIFDHAAASGVGQNKDTWVINNYNYLGSNSNGNNHVIICR